ncbi:MAG: hypothetical protein AAGF66_18905 [Cyanobacteria bacterium P01_H01_bin.119]
MTPTKMRLFTFILLAIIGANEAFLAHSVRYTEGEIVQLLYWMMVILNVPLMAIALWKPRWGLWGGVLLGALLLPWQTADNRKLAQVHAEVLNIIRFVEAEQVRSGAYPATLAGYEFQRDWTAHHIEYGRQGGLYRLSYFVDEGSMEKGLMEKNFIDNTSG